MTLPDPTLYPTSLDTDANLFLVHDAMRVRLLEDYNVGDTSIQVEGDENVLSRFPTTGLITLTEQCSDIDDRALSFYYTSITVDGTTATFSDMMLLPGFNDNMKLKRITNVTQNVMAEHHNHIKDAIIAIENFIGVQGTVDAVPLGPTIVGRINFLRQLAFTPRAWFAADQTIGLVPLTVTFTEQAFHLGDGDVEFLWNFGDGEIPSGSSIFSTASVVPSDISNTLVRDTNGGSIQKTYNRPGKFSVTLTVRNQFGEDTVIFTEMINARIDAPDEAQIDFVPKSSQLNSTGNNPPVFSRLGTKPGGPYTIPPTMRSRVNTFVDMLVPVGNISLERSFAGEVMEGVLPDLSNGTPVDPVVEFTWSLSDDLLHPNARTARASYSVGGIYDLKLRVDTESGAYRITTYENVIDIIENTNLWLWTFQGNTTSVIGHELGLISEVFKTADQTFTVTRDDSFLDGTNNEAQAKREFAKNTGFAPRSATVSGDRGQTFLFWAGGGSSYTTLGLTSQPINNISYEGFGDSYTTVSLTNTTTMTVGVTKPWNWVFLDQGTLVYFVFGADPNLIPNQNFSNQEKTALNLTTNTFVNTTLISDNFKNNAGDLRQHPSAGFDGGGEPLFGRFAVYRSTWKDSTGYFVRNDAVGSFFRILSFYKTEGTIADPFTDIRKLQDIQGPTRQEGELLTLSNGVFFFDNSGTVSAFNTSSETWEVGGVSNVNFRTVQDSTVPGFDNLSNTLLAASDDQSQAFLSYDYSTNAFIKFNSVDLTFTNQGSRPSGTQWIMGIY